MTDQEILREAIDRASKAGYSGWKSFVPAFPHTCEKEKLEKLINFGFHAHKEKIIFSHDFAKAFWGEELLCGRCGKKFADCLFEHKYKLPAFHYHLQKMVLTWKPLEYIAKFL